MGAEQHLYNSKHRLLRVSWGSRITLGSIERHFTLLKSSELYSRRLRVISSSDVEEIGFSLTEENMRFLQRLAHEALENYELVRTAVYGLKPIPAAYVSYFSSFFDSEKSRLKQFETEEAAMEWLLRGIQLESPF